MLLRSGPALALVFAVAGCAEPRPVLYPNAHFNAVGQQAAEQDISACRQMAEYAGASRGGQSGVQVAGGTLQGGAIGAAAGAAGGAVVGAAGRGAAIGGASGAASGFLRSLFRPPQPSAAYRQFVDRCLTERGYDPVGWD